MNSKSPDLTALIERILPTSKSDHFAEITELVEQSVLRTGKTESGPKLAALESHIPVETKALSKDCAIISLDIGGTYTRAALLRSTPTGEERWTTLFRAKHEQLVVGAKSENLFQALCLSLTERCFETLAELNIEAKDINGLGIVWSNAIVSQSLPDSLKNSLGQRILGVSGKVTGKDNDGLFYKKGEPWNPDIHDGDDVGRAILESFLKAGFAIRAVTIANDTILTQKALPGATSGVVSSTGANATIVLKGETTLRNTEIGNSLLIPPELQHPADKIESKALTIEDLVAGVGMQPRLGLHISYLAEHFDIATKEFQNLKNRLNDVRALITKSANFPYVFKGKDLSALISRDFDRFLELRGDAAAIYEDPDLLELLHIIAKNIGLRAGKFAALLAYASVLNQLSNQGANLTVALDSSQAHLINGYFESLTHTMRNLMHSKWPNDSVTVKLLNADPIVTVPMRGAARATNDFLDL